MVPKIRLPHNGWQPRPHQRPLWKYFENGGKRAIEIAHRRWGKDDVVLHRTAVAAFERPGSYWHCLPEFEQARKAIWNSVNPHTGKRRIDEAFPVELRENKDEQQMFIRFRNGSTWQLIGSDRYNNLVGAGVAGVVFSEWALANPASWGYIRPMIEENDGWAAFITTPRGRNHARDMYEMALKNPRWFAEISTIYDTKALSDEQIEESMSEYIALYGPDLGRAQFEQEYLCSFNAAIMGAFYGAEMTRLKAEGRVQPMTALEGRPVHTAWDIGVTDDTSIWWWQQQGSRPVILDCYTNSGGGLEHYAEKDEEVRARHGWSKQGVIDYVPHDAKVKEWGSGRTRVESMRLLGFNPQLVPMATKLDGINAVRVTLGKAIIDPRCETGISALETYRRDWDDNRKMFRATEYRDWSTHLADAFRYLALTWRTQKPKEIVSAPVSAQRGQVTIPGPPKPQRGVKLRL